MTLISNQTISCSECGVAGEFDVYDSVNAQISPELAKKLIDGTLFRYGCPSAGRE